MGEILKATCPDCNGKGVLAAGAGFWDGVSGGGIFVRPERDCDRCDEGVLHGGEAERVLAAAELKALRQAKEISVRDIAIQTNLMLPSQWFDMERGVASLEMIARAKKLLESAV